MTNEEFYLEDLKTKFNKINLNEYYLSYSGGKDSHFLHWFITEILRERESCWHKYLYGTSTNKKTYL